MLVMNICNVCLANPLEPTSDSSVQVISKDSWVLEFYPNYIARNTYSNATGTAHGATYLLADAYFKMMLHQYLSEPTITEVQGGLPKKSFIKKYDQTYGDTCWLYTSGRVWYNGNVNFKLKARIKSSYMGSYLGRWGSYSMIPNTIVSNALYVNR